VAKVDVREARSASTLDLVGAEVLLLQEGALEEFQALLTGKAAEAA